MASPITMTQYPAVSGPSCATGSIACDGDAVDVPLGFKPSVVILFLDAGTEEIYFWFNGMGTALAMVAAAASVAATGAIISHYAGDNDESAGFTIAAAALANSDVVYFIAYP